MDPVLETPPIPPIPPITPPPTPTPTEDPNKGTLELMDRVLAEKQREIDALNARLNAPPPPAPKDPVDSSKFFEDPYKHVGDLIDERLRKATDPLNAFVSIQRRQAALNNYRNIVSNNPNVVKFWPYISAKFDEIANQHIQDNEINETLVGNTVSNLISQFAFNDPLKFAELKGIAVQPPVEPKAVIPPHISPSSSEPPVPSSAPKATLTENEMRLARERWPELSHNDAYDKYVSLRNPGSFVVTPKKSK